LNLRRVPESKSRKTGKLTLALAGMDNATTTQAPGLNGFMARLTEWITGKDARLIQLETEVATLAAIKTELATAQARVVTLTAEVATLKAEVTSLTATNVDIKGKLVVSDEEVNKRVNTIVGQRLATIGIKPVKEELSTDPANQGSLTEQFQKEADPTKRAELYGRIRKEVWGLN
jgi:hypothetical protein